MLFSDKSTLLFPDYASSAGVCLFQEWLLSQEGAKANALQHAVVGVFVKTQISLLTDTCVQHDRHLCST